LFSYINNKKLRIKLNIVCFGRILLPPAKFDIQVLELHAKSIVVLCIFVIRVFGRIIKLANRGITLFFDEDFHRILAF